MSTYHSFSALLQAAADAIRAKTGGSAGIKGDDIPGAILAISGAAAVQEKAVNLRDYDGTIVYSYTLAEFAALTAYPTPPVHPGLTATGWYCDFSQAQAEAAKRGGLEIVATYETDDGTTRVYIKLEKGRTSPYFGLAVNGEVSVDWGDRSAAETMTGTSGTVKKSAQHTYPAPGEYCIKLTVISGDITIIGGETGTGSYLLSNNSDTNPNLNAVYQNSIRRVEIGDNCHLGQCALHRCDSLTSVMVPYTGTAEAVGSYALAECNALLFAALPGAYTLGSYVFSGDNSLRVVILGASPGEYAFSNCYALRRVAVYAMEQVGAWAFTSCYALTEMTVRHATALGRGAFYDCRGLAALHFWDETPPTVSNNNTFTYVPADCIIYVPSGTLSAYTSAANYPSSSTYAYVEE